MFRKIILLRHGESADRQKGQTDFERMLTERGRHSITQLGLFFSREKIFPDIILSSNAVRTTQTTQTLVDALQDLKPTIIYDPALYHGGDRDYEKSILKIKEPMELLVVVGHNPTISSFVGAITGNYSRAFQPGQSALIELDGNSESILSLSGTLTKYIGPFLT